MRKGLCYLFVIAILLLANSCRKALKDVNDYFPKTKIVSATIQTNGTVLVQGVIVSQGDAAIENIGFCYATNKNPNMASNQIMVTANGTKFSATYPVSNFNVDSVYYFRSWATNQYGYAFGNTISLDSIIAVHITPPCTNTMNTVNEGGGAGTTTYTTIDTITNYMNTWSFTAQTYSSPISVVFTFGSAVTTGIYKTTTNSSPGTGEVNIVVNDSFDNGTLNDGSSVYINTIGTNTYDISICSAPWFNGTSTNNFNTRLIVQ